MVNYKRSVAHPEGTECLTEDSKGIECGFNEANHGWADGFPLECITKKNLNFTFRK